MRILPFALASLLAVIGGPAPDVRAAPPRPTGALHERDFDWEIGTWATDVCVLRNPLSGQAPQWAEYRGTSVVRGLLAGRWNFVELSVAGSSGTIEGGSLRLFNPQSRQWSLNFASLKGGVLTAPVYGAFDSGGRGMFTGTDVLEDGPQHLALRLRESRFSAQPLDVPIRLPVLQLPRVDNLLPFGDQEVSTE